MMRRLQQFSLIVLCCIAVSSAFAQEEGWLLNSPDGALALDSEVWTGENGVTIIHGETVLTAERARLDKQTGDAIAEGDVRIEHQGQLWVGDRIEYNFYSRKMKAEDFRTGAPPLFAAGHDLQGDTTNQVYEAHKALITTDDYENPFIVVRAKSIQVIPGNKITARNATIYIGKVPVFYWPYYSRKIGERQNHILFLPGYRSSYGAYLYTGYIWYLNDQMDFTLHTDYRAKRGPGVGPELHFDYGRYGKGRVNYYYAYDLDPGDDSSGQPIDPNRQTFLFDYQGSPVTNFFLKGQFSYESDSTFRQDFFETEYQADPQPITYGEVRQQWSDATLDFYMQPRVNDFYETVERLPDVRLNVFPLQVGSLPFVYESQSSFGHYDRLFAVTNGSGSSTPMDFDGGRVDTFHQLSLPCNLFGWLNIIPRVGGRATYYSETSSAVTNTEAGWRTVFNTGVELSTKASRVWEDAHSGLLNIHGLRHIVQPQINYAYVPTPSRLPNELPQFDYSQPSFFELPIDFPDYNSIDDINAENVVRLGIRNKLQTKRAGAIENVVGWDVFIDWRLDPEEQQSRWSNLYSDLVIRPRSWLTLQSQFQVDVETGNFQQALNTVTISPGTRWSWGVSQWYLREGYFGGTPAQDPGDNTFMSRFYYRFSENWGFRMSHRFNEVDGKLEEQYYTLYRDLRSLTAAVTFRVRDPEDGPDEFSVALKLSIKALPKYSIGEDAVSPSYLLGY